MDPITVSPSFWALAIIIAVVGLFYLWRKEKPKVEVVSIDALAATATATVTTMNKILASKQADLVKLQAELQADAAHVAAAKQSLVALASPPALTGAVTGAPGG